MTELLRKQVYFGNPGLPSKKPLWNSSQDRYTLYRETPYINSCPTRKRERLHPIYA